MTAEGRAAEPPAARWASVHHRVGLPSAPSSLHSPGRARGLAPPHGTGRGAMPEAWAGSAALTPEPVPPPLLHEAPVTLFCSSTLGLCGTDPPEKVSLILPFETYACHSVRVRRPFRPVCPACSG